MGESGGGPAELVEDVSRQDQATRGVDVECPVDCVGEKRRFKLSN